ncbi:ATP-binding protein [Desulfotomaculum nigrificans]|uniref:ATP-binding protein n=1 Tax=Desulfotomaculum nigrificans TaxID=1565 RepID=UPI0001FAEB43|nr:ATP-binding protein [Desulfotomaculum nigrificans]
MVAASERGKVLKAVAMLNAKSSFEQVVRAVTEANVGTGKTHLATAIGVEACKKGLNVHNSLT